MTLLEQIQANTAAVKAGKTALAQAIINKGTPITNPENPTFSELITGVSAIETGTQGAKLFTSIEEMNASTEDKEGDLAVVYNVTEEAITATTKIDALSFPDVVQLETAVTSSASAYLVGAEDTSLRLIQLNLSKTSFIVRDYDTYEVIARYSSSDAITYTRTTTAASFELSTSAKFSGTWKDAYGYFLQSVAYDFGGLFKYQKYVNDRYIEAKILGDTSLDPSMQSESIYIGDFIDIVPKIFSTLPPELVGESIVAEKNLFVERIDEQHYIAYTELHSTSTDLEMLASGCLGDIGTEWYLALDAGARNSTTVAVLVDTVEAVKADTAARLFIRWEVNTATNEVTVAIIPASDFIIRTHIKYDKYVLPVPLDITHKYFAVVYNDVECTPGIIRYSSINVYGGQRLEYGETLGFLTAPTQLTAVSEEVYENMFYGKNGVEPGTLTTDVNTLFTDMNAIVYAKLQQQYDDMQIRVLTNDDKTVDQSIKAVPCKSDGTPLFDTSNVTDASYMFSSCTGLIAIALLDTSKVTNMNRMFEHCTDLVTIPLLDTSSVTNMYAMFLDCDSLTRVPLLDTSNVTEMSGMFQGCKKLQTIPLLDTSSVTSVSSMFHTCTNLQTIPLLDTSSVTDMRYMFQGCTNLQSIPQLNTSNVTTLAYAFQNCANLTTIPLLNTAKVTNWSHTFIGCTNLQSIPQLNTSSATSTYRTFKNCSSLTSVPSISTSKVTGMREMFYGCSSLTSAPSLTTSLVTEMREMFNGCTNLTTVPVYSTSKVTSLYGMFLNCPALSNTSLNNILAMCANATAYTSTKTLAYIGLSEEQAAICTGLSNYSRFTSAGWTTGY